MRISQIYFGMGSIWRSHQDLYIDQILLENLFTLIYLL
ncbi:MAG TPA: hypothetical protein DET40_16105 [Lentisphaeria bacterium]|nr:hypothetical protein [Lentisphaeria bacterium]